MPEPQWTKRQARLFCVCTAVAPSCWQIRRVWWTRGLVRCLIRLCRVYRSMLLMSDSVWETPVTRTCLHAMLHMWLLTRRIGRHDVAYDMSRRSELVSFASAKFWSRPRVSANRSLHCDALLHCNKRHMRLYAAPGAERGTSIELCDGCNMSHWPGNQPQRCCPAAHFIITRQSMHIYQ